MSESEPKAEAQREPDAVAEFGARPQCTRRAKWEVSGPLVAMHFCCEEHKQQWERLTAGWRQPMKFTPVHTFEMRCAV